jgi:putative SOS response-associated peptidase YedK
MCTRFSFVAFKKDIENQFDIEIRNNLRNSYNIAPTHHANIITNDNPDRLQYLTWGLIPYTSREGKNDGKLINARKEGIAGSSSFRIPIRKRRCLVLADSYYVWHKEGDENIPYRVLLKNGEILAMAGVWDIWFEKDYAIKSFSIITTNANREISQISSRMPVILNEKDLQREWLKDINLDRVLELTDMVKNNILKYYAIKKNLNSTRYNMKDIHENMDE